MIKNIQKVLVRNATRMLLLVKEVQSLVSWHSNFLDKMIKRTLYRQLNVLRDGENFLME